MSEQTIEQVTESCAWRARDFTGRDQWAQPFTPAMLEEIDGALRRAVGAGMSYDALTRENFPLPLTESLLADARAELDEGAGFAVLSGFPVERYSYAQNQLVFCGVSAYLGAIADQSHTRVKLQDVVDEGMPYDAHSRAYSSNAYIPFHTDGCDVTGLFCLAPAAEGGESLIVSSAAIYNTFREARPDLLETLSRGFRYHRRGEQGVGEGPVTDHYLPVFSFSNGLFSATYNRYPIEWAQTEIGDLPADDLAALDLLDEIANRPEMHMRMDFQQGDMQFVNNHVVLHSRTGYRDDADHRRHLLRIWLNIPDSRRDGVTTVTLFAPWAQRGAR